MAKETNLTLRRSVDYAFEHSILTTTETAAVDITGWTLSWMLKPNRSTADANALLEKTTSGSGISITGTYDADISTNTQRAIVTIAAADTQSITSELVYYELKRMDDGFETVLAYGRLRILRGVHDQ